MRIFILIVFSFLAFSTPKKNIEIIDSLSNIAFENLIQKTEKSFIPLFIDSPEYFYQGLRSKIFENDLEIKGDSLKLIITAIKPNYRYLNDDLVRDIKFSLMNVKSKNTYSYSYTDTIDISIKDYVEDSIHKFDKSKLPPKKESFFKKYLEPIIIATSSLITIVLLFSVRSS